MIRIGEYGLEAEEHCWKVVEFYEGNNGEEKQKTLAYPTTLASSLNWIQRHMVRRRSMGGEQTLRELSSVIQMAEHTMGYHKRTLLGAE